MFIRSATDAWFPSDSCKIFVDVETCYRNLDNFAYYNVCAEGDDHDTVTLKSFNDRDAAIKFAERLVTLLNEVNQS